MSQLRLQETDGVVVARLSGEIDLSNARDVTEELAGSVANTAYGVVPPATNPPLRWSNPVPYTLSVGR